MSDLLEFQWKIVLLLPAQAPFVHFLILHKARIQSVLADNEKKLQD